MEYRLFFEQPERHFIRIEMDLPPSNGKPTTVKLSRWRPGRYELGPYVENITSVHASTPAGKALQVRKTAYNHWEVQDSGTEPAILHYHYHAIAPDAGASYFDEHQVYVNGVNLFMYIPGHIDQPCRAKLHLPDRYRIACGMKQEGQTLIAEDFHQLVDCPFIASQGLQHRAFQVEGITHNLWFQGECRPDFDRLENDFTRFGAAQTKLFGHFPASEYHYIFQIHSRAFYHGVEHQNSTVLAFGPGFRIMQPDMYQELLGLCSHELFHAWNVKAIRPADMRPYDYDNHNYSALHYITEGVTTYYGDLMLLKAGVWPLSEYIQVFNESVLKRHYANNGRDHITLEQASFDSWLNGYKPGVPNRKISFYTKGCLAAFILDYGIRAATRNARSLDTLMRDMYARFGHTGIGYTKEDYKALAEAHAGFSLNQYFRDVIEGTVPLEPMLQDAAEYFGLQLIPRRPGTIAERLFGFLAEEADRVFQVRQIWEGSPAAQAGLAIGDEPVALNGLRVNAATFETVLAHLESEPEIHIQLFRSDRLITIMLERDPAYTLERWMLSIIPEPSPEQIKNRIAWITLG